MQKPVVLLLAGGVGKRFKPFVINKTLFPFFGKPLLQHVLETLQKNNLDEIIIITNEQNEAWLKIYSNPKLHLQTIRQEKAEGMGAAMLLAEKAIAGRSVIVSGMHLWNDQFLATFLDKTKQVSNLIPARRFREYFPGGYLKVENDRVVAIIEKPKPEERPSDLVNIVFDYFSAPHEFINLIKETKTENDDQYEKALELFLQKENVKWIEYDDYYQSLKTIYNVLDMTEVFLQHHLQKKTSASAQISSRAEIIGDVQIDENAKINAFAVVKGPAYIGRNVIVGEHVLIRSSIIEENSTVGCGSEIARSYVGPKCSVHHAYAGDSVLENNVEMAYGSCTANLRFDHQQIRPTNRIKLGAFIAKGAFIGVNASLMPGVCIEENTKIYPNSVVK